MKSCLYFFVFFLSAHAVVSVKLCTDFDLKGSCYDEHVSSTCREVRYIDSISSIHPYDRCIYVYRGYNCVGDKHQINPWSVINSLGTIGFNDIIKSFKAC